MRVLYHKRLKTFFFNLVLCVVDEWIAVQLCESFHDTYAREINLSFIEILFLLTFILTFSLLT